MTARLAAVLVGALLAACASVHFVKPGATPWDFEQDKAACQAQALGSGTQNPFIQIDIVKLCLRGRGWQQEAAPPPAPAGDEREP